MEKCKPEKKSGDCGEGNWEENLKSNNTVYTIGQLVCRRNQGNKRAGGTLMKSEQIPSSDLRSYSD